MARGSVVKRKSGNYAIVYRIGGKQRWKTIGPNKKEAEAALAEVLVKINRGEFREQKKATFNEFAEKWLSYMESRVKETTYRFYRDIVVPHLIPYFGDYNLKAITPYLIEEYLTQKKKERKLSETTLSYHLRVLKTIFKKAIIWNYLVTNPAEKVEKPPRSEKREMNILTLDELRKFLKIVKETDRKYYPLFLTAALTGMRRGELLALKWEDINWEKGQIHVRRSVYGNKFRKPKTKTAIRAIIVPPTLLKVLKKWQLACPPSELNLVFPNEKGKVKDAHNLVNRHFLPALKRAGVKRIRFHDLRHTYASILIAQGENLKFIQSQLGHASAQMTLDRYGHLMPQVQHGVAERLERTLFGSDSKHFVSNLLAERVESQKIHDSLLHNISSQQEECWWAMLDLNQRPPACEAGALPLSQSPTEKIITFKDPFIELKIVVLNKLKTFLNCYIMPI